jgi:predicted transcriptional regulator
LRYGETLSDFVEQAIRDSISRRQYQRDISTRGLAGHGEAARSAEYVSAGAVLLQLENMLAEAKASN